MASFSPFGRWVPPAYTPIPASGLARAARTAAVGGNESPGLRELLVERYAADRVVLTDSGTNALQLAFHAVRPSARNEHAKLALPAFACFDLVTAVIGAGVDAVFFDVSPRTLEPSWPSLYAALESGVDAVLLAPLFGLPGGTPRVRGVAAAADLPFIEDAAQGFGSSPAGHRAGTHGDVAVLSFGRGKGWTGGGGGALVVRGASDRVPPPTGPPSGSPGVLTRSIAQWVLGHPARYGVPASIPALHIGETRYHSPAPPRPMARASVSLAFASLGVSVAESESRRAMASRLIEGIGGGATWCKEGGYLRLPVLLPSAHAAAEFALVNRRLGVARSYPTPLPALDVLGCSVDAEVAFPGASELASRLVTLPTHSYLKDEEADLLVKRVRAANGYVVGPRDD